MANTWCRIWNDMPTDPKWRAIAKRTGRPVTEVIAVYVTMMVNSNVSSERGTLERWDDEDQASALDLETEQVTAIREAMQGKVLDGNRLTGWEKRQRAKEDYSTERVQRFREKALKRNAMKRNETQGNAPYTDTDTDTDSDSDTDSEQSVESLERIIAQLTNKICMISNQVEIDTVSEWTKAVPEDWINEAIKIAALNKVRNIKYIDSILVNWAGKYKPEEKPWEAKRNGHGIGRGKDGRGKDGRRTDGEGDVPEGFWD